LRQQQLFHGFNGNMLFVDNPQHYYKNNGLDDHEYPHVDFFVGHVKFRSEYFKEIHAPFESLVHREFYRLRIFLQLVHMFLVTRSTVFTVPSAACMKHVLLSLQWGIPMV
jgi:hypothetical protein